MQEGPAQIALPRQGSVRIRHQLTAASCAAVILAAVFIIFAGYLAVGFAGYLAYPTTVDSNVLKSFPKRPVLLKASSRGHCSNSCDLHQTVELAAVILSNDSPGASGGAIVSAACRCSKPSQGAGRICVSR